jgi:hypothetical protein
MEKPVCSKCNSDEVCIDSWAKWDYFEQAWTIDSTFNNAFCRNCDGECKLSWIPS